MSAKEYCKRIVDGCKARLKTEQDDERKRYWAVIGEEFNKTMLQLNDGYEQVSKICKCCGRPKPLDQFGKVKQVERYIKKDGTVSEYHRDDTRSTCKTCMNQHKRKKIFQPLDNAGNKRQFRNIIYSQSS